MAGGSEADIRTPEEQVEYRDQHLSEQNRMGYEKVSRRMAANTAAGCPFVPDPEGYVPPLNWNAIGGPPPGLAAQEICDAVYEQTVKGLTSIQSKKARNYTDPELPSAPPPPRGSNYIQFMDWIISEDPDGLEIAFLDDSPQQRLVIDMMCGFRPDVFAKYEQPLAVGQRGVPSHAPSP